MTVMRKWSTIFKLPFINDIKIQCVSKSQKLFLLTSLAHVSDGLAILSPPLIKSLHKLKQLIRREMEDISAQEILLPSLINSTLLDISGKTNWPDLLSLNKVDNKVYFLSPTGEEAITNFIASMPKLEHNQLPLRFYQISNKFRDERRPKSGLLRCREFIMKDLYGFDSSFEESEKFYNEVVNKYHHILQVLKVPFVFVKGCVGEIGGLYSDEFHILSQTGEDMLILCKNCGFKENSQRQEKLSDVVTCSSCKSTNVVVERGIEIGHTFNLGTVYTKPFKAFYHTSDKQPEVLHMSCYGLGLTRLLAASVEVLSEDDKIRWPLAIAPYLLCVIPPKMGSKEEIKSEGLAEKIYQELSKYLVDEVVYFDRNTSTIGKNKNLVDKVGFPFAVIVGKGVHNDPPVVEVLDLYSKTVDFVKVPDVTRFVLQKIGWHGNIST